MPKVIKLLNVRNKDNFHVFLFYLQAAEVIKQQIEINPTVKLYCLLGDATGKKNFFIPFLPIDNDLSNFNSN